MRTRTRRTCALCQQVKSDTRMTRLMKLGGEDVKEPVCADCRAKIEENTQEGKRRKQKREAERGYRASGERTMRNFKNAPAWQRRRIAEALEKSKHAEEA